MLHSYLKGVKRRMFVDSGAAASVIHNTQDPRKSRIFKVQSVERSYLSNWYKSSDIYWSDEEEDHDDNNDNKEKKNAIPVDTQQEELKMEEEDLEEDSVKKRDVSCLDSLTKNDVALVHEKGSTANVNLSKITTPGKEEILEGCRNNVVDKKQTKLIVALSNGNQMILVRVERLAQRS